MTADDLLNEALKLINKAKSDSRNFMSDYPANLRATGESSSAYSLYEFELSDNYYLVIDFVDLSFEDFSIVCRGHESHIVYNSGEEDAE